MPGGVVRPAQVRFAMMFYKQTNVYHIESIKGMYCKPTNQATYQSDLQLESLSLLCFPTSACYVPSLQSILEC
jgi:hypothetical protein